MKCDIINCNNNAKYLIKPNGIFGFFKKEMAVCDQCLPFIRWNYTIVKRIQM